MRTTITLEPDVAAAVEKIRKEERVGVSQAVNRLVRAGLARPAQRKPYIHRSANVGVKVDVTCVGKVLDILDER